MTARYQIDKYECTEGYNTFTLPDIAARNSSITPGSPSGTWTAIGWRNDQNAGNAHFAPLESVKMNPYVTAFYAVYKKTVTVGYNSNGGTG